jgi:hypothetical protein
VVAFAREHSEVTVIVPAAARKRAGDAGGVEGVAISVDGWPREVVAAVYPSRSPEQCLQRLEELDDAGVRSIVYHFGQFDGASRALTARASGLQCMGALIADGAPEGADRAWRGLPSDG